ncbi:MAG: DNA-binding LytR/AlgR family response regulator [Arenicella sp.]|jgi:DNA-binding LytR/AlgR family response regulator
MLNSIRNKLQSPYPANFHWKNGLKSALLFGFFIGFFLWYFRPYDFGNPSKIGIISSCFGLITFFCVVFNSIFLPKFLPRLFDEERWALGREVLAISYNTAFVGLFNGFFVLYLSPSDHSLRVLWELQIATFSVGALPIIVSTLYKQNLLLRRNLEKANSISKKIQSSQSEKQGLDSEKEVGEVISILAENGTVELEIASANLQFAKSEGNYLEIHYSENGESNRQVIRNTLKSMELIVSNQKHFFRCHRSYLVNLELVSSISGNARGYELSLKNSSHIIPVSRGKIEALKERI